MLTIENLHVSYGNIKALHGVDLQIEKGEIVALIGSNGAGKSSLLNTISGLIKPEEGKVVLDGELVSKKSPNEIVEMGVAQVPEGRRIFASMSVLENLEMGAYLPENRRRFKENIEYVYQLFPILSERRQQKAGTLSGGEQQMLAVGRALMSNPQWLLLDEPSLGLAPVLVDDLYEAIVEIRKLGTTLFIVEQNAFQALRVADRGYVLETGNITMEQEANQLLANDEVRQAYLGG
jgi:branched-chain amino acid transport system ATP-binding protein